MRTTALPPEPLRELYERQVRAAQARPSYARGAGRAHARILEGLTCEVRHEDRTQIVDASVADGGGGSAPHPGQLMRASLAACLAMGYRSWGARAGIDLDDVEVIVTCEYDARGQLGISDQVPVGWQRVTIEVALTTTAPQAEARALVEKADRLSPMLANLSPTIERVHRLTVRRPSGEEG